MVLLMMVCMSEGKRWGGGCHASNATHKGAPYDLQNKKLLDNFEFFEWRRVLKGTVPRVS